MYKVNPKELCGVDKSAIYLAKRKNEGCYQADEIWGA